MWLDGQRVRGVILLDPAQPHASTDLASRCSEHTRAHEPRREPQEEGRLWRVAGDQVVTDPRPDHSAARLSPGTLLRLDRTTAQGFREGNFGPDGHWIVSRRFCVLDGPAAGTCWEAQDLEDMRDPTHTQRDLVERVS
jgi:hypothetical protein